MIEGDGVAEQIVEVVPFRPAERYALAADWWRPNALCGK
jgi:hypothetical protein